MPTPKWILNIDLLFHPRSSITMMKVHSISLSSSSVSLSIMLLLLMPSSFFCPMPPCWLLCRWSLWGGWISEGQKLGTARKMQMPCLLKIIGQVLEMDQGLPISLGDTSLVIEDRQAVPISPILEKANCGVYLEQHLTHLWVRQSVQRGQPYSAPGQDSSLSKFQSKSDYTMGFIRTWTWSEDSLYCCWSARIW